MMMRAAVVVLVAIAPGRRAVCRGSIPRFVSRGSVPRPLSHGSAVDGLRRVVGVAFTSHAAIFESSVRSPPSPPPSALMVIWRG